MFLVVMLGATVTTTGSGQGCGRSWPLCHGQLLPPLSLPALIEYSHRLATGLVGILMAVLAASILRYWRGRRDLLALVALMVLTLVVQSALGAWAVLAPQSPLVMALHFGVSLTSFASVLLVAAVLLEEGRAEPYRSSFLPLGVTTLIWGSLGFTYVVVYLGAYVRHTNASLACLDWPLCQGQLVPGFSGPVGMVFLHRLAALVGTLLLGALVLAAARWRRQRPDLFWGSLLALGLVLAQSVSGAVLVFSRLDLVASLAHSGIVVLLFGCLSYLALRTLPRPASQPVLQERTLLAMATRALER
jgi:cytochrome c oxidase assembly protein subunit 15